MLITLLLGSYHSNTTRNNVRPTVINWLIPLMIHAFQLPVLRLAPAMPISITSIRSIKSFCSSFSSHSRETLLFASIIDWGNHSIKLEAWRMKWRNILISICHKNDHYLSTENTFKKPVDVFNLIFFSRCQLIKTTFMKTFSSCLIWSEHYSQIASREVDGEQHDWVKIVAWGGLKLKDMSRQASSLI